MTDNRIQQLYDRAFERWQEEKGEEALELIGQALDLAPEDLSLHALAIHIKKKDFLTFGFVPHAEFIIDSDAHYLDTIDESRGPRDYIDHLMHAYFLMQHMADKDMSDVAPMPNIDIDDIDRRFHLYGTKVLQAGLGLPNLSLFLETLLKLKRYDEVIDIGFYISKTRSAAEIGLPGLEHCDREEGIFDDADECVMKAFYYANRNEDALKWCLAMQREDPLDWYIHIPLGEVYSRLGRPAEAARQWIVALQKGAHTEASEGYFKDLCRMVADPEAAMKIALCRRIREAEKEVVADRKAVADKVHLNIHRTIGDPKSKIMPESYVENKIGVKLPPLQEHHFRYFVDRLWLPNQGPHPFLPPPAAPAEPPPETQGGITPRKAIAKPKTIERYGVDLTEQASAGRLPPIVGREREIESLVRILLRMEKNNPVLLGAAGVGKTAVLQGLAQRIVSKGVPPLLRGRRVLEMTMSALVSGTTWRGDFEQRITEVIREARDNPEIILFVDELHTIMGAGSANRGDLDAANIVKPALAKGELRLVGATTTGEYHRYIEKDPAMARRFTPVRVAELDRAATLEVLRGRRAPWREYHHVEIPDDVLEDSLDLVDLHVRHRRFPDKAIDLLDESCAYARTRRPADGDTPIQLTMDEVRHILMEWTGAAADAPAAEPEENGAPTAVVPARKGITALFREHIAAQDEAVDRLSDLIVQLRLSLRDPATPLALLFHGPAGTGKTTCVRTLANILWPGETDRIMTLNLAEYAASSAIHRLIGAPPGYSGYSEGGLLTARLKRQPYSIVLLKNVSRANPRVIDFFSDLLRHGSYTDGFGNEIAAADALFIAHFNTSARSRAIGFADSSPDDPDRDGDQVLRLLERLGLPRRFTRALVHHLPFVALSPETTRDVLRMRLDKLRRAYDRRNLHLVLTDRLVERLTRQFLDLPAEQRNVEALIDRRVVPLIREAILSAGTDAQTGEIIVE